MPCIFKSGGRMCTNTIKTYSKSVPMVSFCCILLAFSVSLDFNRYLYNWGSPSCIPSFSINVGTEPFSNYYHLSLISPFFYWKLPDIMTEQHSIEWLWVAGCAYYVVNTVYTRSWSRGHRSASAPPAALMTPVPRRMIHRNDWLEISFVSPTVIVRCSRGKRASSIFEPSKEFNSHYINK